MPKVAAGIIRGVTSQHNASRSGVAPEATKSKRRRSAGSTRSHCGWDDLEASNPFCVFFRTFLRLRTWVPRFTPAKALASSPRQRSGSLLEPLALARSSTSPNGIGSWAPGSGGIRALTRTTHGLLPVRSLSCRRASRASACLQPSGCRLQPIGGGAAGPARTHASQKSLTGLCASSRASRRGLACEQQHLPRAGSLRQAGKLDRLGTFVPVAQAVRPSTESSGSGTPVGSDTPFSHSTLPFENACCCKP